MKRSRVSTITAVVLGVGFALGLAFAAGAQELSLMTEAGDPVQGVPDDGDWPDGEAPPLAFDQDAGTKYLHRAGEDTGVRVTPSQNDLAVKALNFRAANDTPGRDPVAFQLSGSNESIDGPYTLIAEGEIADFNQEDPWDRDTWISEPIEIDNDQVYEHYEIFFPTLRDPEDDGLMQINEIELLGAPAEPTPYAADFDGDSGIVVADGPAISGQTEQFSVMMWVKGPAGQADKRVFSEGSFSDGDPLFNIGTDNDAATGQLDIYYRRDDGSTFVNHGKSEGEPFDGTWHHVAVVVDNGTLSMYIDGEQDPTVLEFDPGLISVENTSIAGIQREDPSHWFEGSIAHVGVFSRALGGAEIQRYMNQELRGSESGLEAYWPLGEGEGETANDLSSNAFDGDMQGGFEWVQAPDLPVEPAAEAPMPDELTRGAALDLDGESWVNTGALPGDLGIDGDSPRTIEAWAYTRVFDGDGTVYSMGGDPDAAEGEDFFMVTRDEDNGWNAAYIAMPGQFDFPSLNQWVHFATVYTGSEAITYANGEEMLRNDYDINTDNVEPLRFGGGWARRGDIGLDGMVTEMRAWDRALSQAEILANMHASLEGNEDGLVGYWPGEEGEGDTLFDLSPNENHATIEGPGQAQWASEEVPNLAGLHWEEAATTLEDAGFQVHIEFVQLGEVETGQVHAQAPGGGQTSAPYWTVVLQVEAEPQSFAPVAPAWLMLIVMTGLLSVAGLRMRKGVRVS